MIKDNDIDPFGEEDWKDIDEINYCCHVPVMRYKFIQKNCYFDFEFYSECLLCGKIEKL